MREHALNEHSSHGPSQWPRLIRCPGSFRASEGLPDEASFEAAEGTVYHDLVATCLQHGFDPWQFVREERKLQVDGYLIPFDEEMAWHADEAIRSVQEYEEDPDWQTFVEVPVDISEWAGPDQKGTADYLAVNAKQLQVVLIDWKYGRGVPVFAEYGGRLNEQLLGYALGAWRTILYPTALDSRKGEASEMRFAEWVRKQLYFDLRIVQPRYEGAGGQVRRTLADLMQQGDRVRKELDKTRLRNPPRAAGETQCRFCPAAGPDCPEHTEWVISAFDLPDVDALLETDGEQIEALATDPPPDLRSHALKLRPFVERFFKTIHADAYNDALQGAPVPGWKLVEGRLPKRAWVDGPGPSRHLQQVLPDPLDAYERKLISPARAEKLIGKQEFRARFSGYIAPADRKLILVPDDDPRIGVETALDEFEDLTQGPTEISEIL